MKTGHILIMAGLGLLTYWLLRKAGIAGGAASGTTTINIDRLGSELNYSPTVAPTDVTNVGSGTVTGTTGSTGSTGGTTNPITGSVRTQPV